ncbi:hypothetical protein EKK58_05650 [Candidatus Dependentiae bacterium]|nr:MAG: hypothetical protein EKK58_05650 [Candidatus Dependentiae bacterium]
MTQPTANDASDALNDIFRLMGWRHLIAKADNDPLERQGFLEVIRMIMRQLVSASAPAEGAAYRRMLQLLDVDWPTLTEEAREHVIRRATAAIGGISGSVTPKVEAVLVDAGHELILKTKKAVSGRYGLRITPTFHAVDKAVVKAAAKTNSFFVRDEYGNRQQALSVLARKIVAKGLERGLDRYDIGRELKEALDAAGLKRSEAYYRMVASIFAARSRSIATLSGFEEAGISEYLWSSVVDEVTTDFCRMMNGQTFSTRRAIDRYAKVAASDDPEIVIQLQPFVGKSRDEEGEYLYYRQGEQRVLVARVDQSAVGERDKIGLFSKAMNQGQLENAGLTTPPAHPHCRSLIIPA